MRSFKSQPDNRRSVYLSLVGAIEAGLRDAYAVKHEAGQATQSSIARKLGVSRSTINKRLKGQNNMTLETVADMVWALGQCVRVEIFDPTQAPTNGHRIEPVHPESVTFEWDAGATLQSNQNQTPNRVKSGSRKAIELEFHG